MFTRIIVPLDGSVAAERAILTAAVLTRRSRACIDLVHVRRPPLWAAGAPMYDTRLDDEEARKESTIAARAAVLVASGLNVHCTNLEGEVNDALELYAAESDADLIVMSSGGAHTSRGAMGKVARHLVRSAGVPVLLVRGSGAEAAVRPRSRTVGWVTDIRTRTRLGCVARDSRRERDIAGPRRRTVRCDVRAGGWRRCLSQRGRSKTAARDRTLVS
jgi:nucleotide-binding universal stress UspA family protein